MTLRLNGSSSGYIELDAPAAAGSNTITLPTSNGSAEQFLKNSGTAGELEYSSMIEDSSGRLGIGTTSPSSLIHGEVSSGSATLTLKSTATSGEASVSRSQAKIAAALQELESLSMTMATCLDLARVLV